MNRNHKVALILTITISLGLVVGIGIIVIGAIVMGGFDASLAKKAMMCAAFVGGSGGIISIFTLKDAGPVAKDERDRAIDKNACLAGFGAVYLLVIIVSFAPVGIAPEASIPTKYCPYLLIIAGFCQTYAMSIAILIQHRFGVKSDA